MTQKEQQCHSFNSETTSSLPAMHTEMYSQTNITLLYSIFPHLPPACPYALTPNEVYCAVHVIFPPFLPVFS